MNVKKYMNVKMYVNLKRYTNLRKYKNFKKVYECKKVCEYTSRVTWLNHVLCVSVCQRGLVPTSCVPTYQKHDSMPINVLTCPTACQRSKQSASFSVWCSNVPKGVPPFQTFLLRNTKGSFFTLLLHEKLYIILDIIVIHMYMYRT